MYFEKLDAGASLAGSGCHLSAWRGFTTTKTAQVKTRTKVEVKTKAKVKGKSRKELDQR